MDPIQEGVYDSFRVLRNCIASSSGIASNLLLCDELLKARQMVSRCRIWTRNQSMTRDRDDRKAQGLGKGRDEWNQVSGFTSEVLYSNIVDTTLCYYAPLYWKSLTMKDCRACD